MKKTNILLSSLITSLSFIFLASPVHSQMSITAIPPKVELKGDPGQTLTATLKVRNGSSETQSFTVSVEDFIVIDNIGTPIPITTKINNRWSLANWISAPKEIPVDSGGTQIINVSIKIPMTALSGGHYAMVTYTPNTENKPGDLRQTGNVITQRVGTLIYVTVNGPVTEKATLTRFAPSKFTEKGPVEFKGTIESLSDVHINPKGTITIYDPFNAKVADIPIDAGYIFPETSRDFSAKWNQEWGWGRYKANLNLVFGSAETPITATIFFWFFPVRLVVYSLIALISVLMIIIFLNKRSKKHQEDLEKEVLALKQELQNNEKK
ncbi:MAG TPA: hypothetical protein PLI45_04825 [Candidatus Woesebacteria bacterium]|nr:hypothetical protein [Candidatus Woesebacteria bacterium]